MPRAGNRLSLKTTQNGYREIGNATLGDWELGRGDEIEKFTSLRWKFALGRVNWRSLEEAFVLHADVDDNGEVMPFACSGSLYF